MTAVLSLDAAIESVGIDNSASIRRSLVLPLMGVKRPFRAVEELHHVAVTRAERRQPVKLDYFRVADYSPEKDRRRHNRLYQEGDQTRGHERSCPDQVEVEPRLTEKCEAELLIDHPRDQPCDCKIGDRMDAGGEHPGQWAGAR